MRCSQLVLMVFAKHQKQMWNRVCSAGTCCYRPFGPFLLAACSFLILWKRDSSYRDYRKNLLLGRLAIFDRSFVLTYILVFVKCQKYKITKFRQSEGHIEVDITITAHNNKTDVLRIDTIIRKRAHERKNFKTTSLLLLVF